MKLELATLTGEQKEAFAKSFYENWPNDNPDYEASCPWGCPWLYETEIEVSGSTPEEWGQSWWETNKAEIMKLLAEEEAMRDEQDD